MASTQRTIVNLEPECLRKIAKFLSCEDIVNIAEAFNLTEANISSLEQQIQTGNSNHSRFMLFRLAKALRQLFLGKNGESLDFWPDEIAVVKHFGKSVRHLKLDYIEYTSQVEIEELNNTILLNCCDTVESLELSGVDEKTFASICKPFANVTKVHICCHILSEKLSQFNRWFPKMNELRLQALQFEKLECLEHHFPNLKHLSIDTTSDWHYGRDDDPLDNVITDSNVKIMLHHNPQLERLELNDNHGGRDDFGVCLSPKFLSYVARKLPNLRGLTLEISFLDYEFSHQQGTIHFKRLSSLNISVSDWSYLSKFSIATKQPLNLSLDSNSCRSNTQPIYENIAKFTKKMTKNLNSLTIQTKHNERDLYAKYMIDLVISLERLGSFEIQYDWRRRQAADAIIYFLTNCKQIKKFTCGIEDFYSLKNHKKTQLEFIDSFNAHTKTIQFDAANWDIKFKRNGAVSISKRN